MKNFINYSIRNNIWGNFYGYANGKKVISFAETSQHTQEENARIWLDKMEDLDREVNDNQAT